MSKPTTLPEWATGGGASVVEPLLAEKQLGWVASTKPPASWFNWILLTIYNWIVWLDAFENTAHTWSALQTFTGGLTVSSAATFNAAAHFADAATFDNAPELLDGANLYAAMNAPDASAARKLVMQSKVAASPDRWVRLYAVPHADGAGFELTYNASEAAGTWTKDDSATYPYAFRMRLGRGFRYDEAPVGASFLDAAWVSIMNLQGGLGAREVMYGKTDGSGTIEHSTIIPQDSWATVSLAANVNAASGQTPQWFKDSVGIAHVRGVVEANTTIASGTQIATLDAEILPDRTLTFSAMIAELSWRVGQMWITVDTAGAVKLVHDGSISVIATTPIRLDFDFRAA